MAYVAENDNVRVRRFPAEPIFKQVVPVQILRGTADCTDSAFYDLRFMNCLSVAT